MLIESTCSSTKLQLDFKIRLGFIFIKSPLDITSLFSLLYFFYTQNYYSLDYYSRYRTINLSLISCLIFSIFCQSCNIDISQHSTANEKFNNIFCCSLSFKLLENRSFFTRSPLLESSLLYCLIGEILFLGGSRFIWGRGRSI